MKYYVTSPSFGGFVEFVFNGSGVLVLYNSTDAIMSDDQHIWFNRQLHLNHDQFISMMESTPNLKHQRVTTEVTFAMIWDRYDDKSCSSKKKSEIKWSKMSMADRVKAYYYIPRYFSSLGANIRKKYLETYLNSELWNN